MYKLTIIKIVLILIALTSNSGYSQNSAEVTGKIKDLISETAIMKINDSKEVIFSGKSDEISSIPFEIKSEGNVTLSIFNENGNLVQALVEGYMYPGYYNVIFKPEPESKSVKYYYVIK